MANLRNHPYAPQSLPHPGESVVEYLEAHGWSQSDLARRTGLTPKTISEICNGKTPISPTTALALEKVFQRPAHFWLNLQCQYDEAVARQRARAEAEGWTEWVSRFPLAEMKKFRFLKGREGQSDVDALLEFLGVSSPGSWDSVWQASRVAYRQTRKFKTSPEAIAVWVRETEIVASAIDTAPFSEALLRVSIDELRRQTARPVDEAIDSVQAICAGVGVAVVWVPELPHMGVSGCARWLTSTKALVALTLRYKTDDQMWFTFFHELGHILLHKRTRAFVLDNAVDTLADKDVDPEMQKAEEEANSFARDTLIPPSGLAQFIRTNDFSNDAVKRFAHEVGIGPGIVVGRLQHDGILRPHQGNALKQKLSFGMKDDA